MDTIAKQTFIRRKARENRSDPTGSGILWTRHAIAELANEGWVRRAVEHGLVTSQVIEDYPVVHRPLPDCLALSQLTSGEPFHAVLAIDITRDVLVVVTVYRPSLEEWDNDWKTRRR
jgi:hypothetical protein